MPSIDIKTLRLDTSTKDHIAEKLFEGAKRVLKIPSWEIYFNEYESFYVRGKPASHNFISIIVEGPNLEPDVLANLCSTLTEAITQVIPDPDLNVNFLYNAHPHEHAGHNGKLLSQLSRRQHQSSEKVPK